MLCYMCYIYDCTGGVFYSHSMGFPVEKQFHYKTLSFHAIEADAAVKQLYVMRVRPAIW